ncbi:hypothetical protein E2C01_037680 [Portunus trituberculatus]|uniref:Uncharacterized protein n=1 Tax=Portunus trituberculatus TaxID=210409 RepID=A0A5B7F9Z8_PORTR|nr:hypothetical protein [Portunus trituberculatus]
MRALLASPQPSALASPRLLVGFVLMVSVVGVVSMVVVEGREVPPVVRHSGFSLISILRRAIKYAALFCVRVAGVDGDGGCFTGRGRAQAREAQTAGTLIIAATVTTTINRRSTNKINIIIIATVTTRTMKFAQIVVALQRKTHTHTLHASAEWTPSLCVAAVAAICIRVGSWNS